MPRSLKLQSLPWRRRTATPVLVAVPVCPRAFDVSVGCGGLGKTPSCTRCAMPGMTRVEGVRRVHTRGISQWEPAVCAPFVPSDVAHERLRPLLACYLIESPFWSRIVSTPPLALPAPLLAPVPFTQL